MLRIGTCGLFLRKVRFCLKSLFEQFGLMLGRIAARTIKSLKVKDNIA